MKTRIDPTIYVEQMSEILDLPIDPAYYPGVVKNVANNFVIATLVTEFSLPENIEAAPVFEP